MSEKKELHDPFIKYLKSKNLKFIRKNWNNKNRQVDDGYPDFIIFLNEGITLFVEFKTWEKYNLKNNGLNDKQIEWEEYLTRKLHNYLLTYKVIFAINFVEIFLRNKEDE